VTATRAERESNIVDYTPTGLVQQEEYRFQKSFSEIQDFENKAYSITHPGTGEQLEYRNLREYYPKFKQVWDGSSSNEFGQLAQGIGLNADGSQQVKGTRMRFVLFTKTKFR
jgi:hypothetical protein